MRSFQSRLGVAVLLAPLLLGPAPVAAQYEQGHEHHQNFYNGAYDAGRGGSYSNGHDYGYAQRGNDGRGYNDRGYDERNRGHGIGTGTGAALGGAGGALLGAAFGGGLKGAIIGGAAGAGIGAIAGHAHQENERRDYNEHR